MILTVYMALNMKEKKKKKKEKRIDNNLSERSRVIEPVEGSGRRSATCSAHRF